MMNIEMPSKNIALIGKPGVGKTKFIHLLNDIPLRKNYYVKTISHEVHPVSMDVNIWEFGNYTDGSNLRNMHGIIQIGKCPYDALPDIPVLRIEKDGWNTQKDVQTILNDFVKTL